MTVTRVAFTVAMLACLVAGTPSAQSRWGGNVALGYGWPLGDAADRFDGNIAFGLTWPISRTSEFYIEARYHWVDKDNGSLQFVPLMLGFKF